MSDDATTQLVADPAPAELPVARSFDSVPEVSNAEHGAPAGSNVEPEKKEAVIADEKSVPEEKASVDPPKPTEEKPLESAEPTEVAPKEETKPEVAATDGEATVADAPATDEPAPADASADGEGATSASNKSKSARRKSGVPEHKSKKLSKKASKAKITHTDAKPGEHYFIRLKGYPPWPGIICDESMLPHSLIKSRPVTAARPDGTYRADFEDGGKKVNDRTFPVMYLATNEFGWIPNFDLEDLNVETVGDVQQGKMRKDLYQAHQLAAENHDLDFYKNMLQEFQQQRQAEIDAKNAAKAAKAAKAANKGKRKSKGAAEVEEGGEDIEMEDVAGDDDEPKSSKKRKAGTDADDVTSTPQGSETAKKPKIKLTTTPKANGSATPKSSTKKEHPSKAKPPKASKAKNGDAATQAAPEPELSPEEKREKKQKEILFLRHKLQKGLLTRDQQPKEDEMKQMSEFITKLEGYAELEVSIIRATKINKVLKAILKLEEIPKEAEFNFKDRSQVLLIKWNKILDSETPSVSTTATAPTTTNGSAPTELENDVSANAESKEPSTTEPKTKSEDGTAPSIDAAVAAPVEAPKPVSAAPVAEPIISAPVDTDIPMKDVKDSEVPAVASTEASEPAKPVEAEIAIEATS